MKKYSIITLIFAFSALMGMDTSASKSNVPFGKDPVTRAVLSGIEQRFFEGAEILKDRIRAPFFSSKKIEEISPDESKSIVPVGPVSKSTAHFQGIEKRIVERIDQVPSGGFIGIQAPFFSSKPIEKAARSAQERGARVVRHGTARDAVGRAESCQKKAEKSGKQLAKKVTKSAIQPADTQISNLHAKRVLISDIDPEKENTLSDSPSKKRKYTVFEGSHNLSELAKYHHEMMVETQDDSPHFKRHYELFKQDAASKTPPAKKQVIQKTPDKKAVVSSRDVDLLKSKAERVRSLFKDPQPGSSADIVSMGFDSSPMVKHIKEGYQELESPDKPRIRFILDRSAEESHPDKLRQLKEAGGEHLDIYTYNKGAQKKIFGKIPELQHMKSMTIEKGGKKSVVISTGNLVPQSDRDLNIDTYFPRDDQLFGQTRLQNEKVIRKSTKYELPIPTPKDVKKRIEDID